MKRANFQNTDPPQAAATWNPMRGKGPLGLSEKTKLLIMERSTEGGAKSSTWR